MPLMKSLPTGLRAPLGLSVGSSLERNSRTNGHVRLAALGNMLGAHPLVRNACLERSAGYGRSTSQRDGMSRTK